MIQEPDLLKQKEIKRKSSHKKTRIILMVLSLVVLTRIGWSIFQNIANPLEGRVRATEEAEIQVLSEGVLQKVIVQNSSFVKEGEPLFEFENANLEVALLNASVRKENIARAMETLDKESILSLKRFESAKILHENGVIAQTDLDDQELKASKIRDEMESKKKEMNEVLLLSESLKKEKDGLTIKAPFDGIFLGDLDSKRNTYFKKGEKLGLVFKPTHFYFDTEVTEEKTERIKIGNRASLKFKAIKGIYSGKVVRVNAQVQETVEKVYKTKYVSKLLIEIENPPDGILPGMRGTARIIPSLSLPLSFGRTEGAS